MLDWRLPENRVEAFLRFYQFHLKHKSHPGGVYYLLPAIAEEYLLDEAGKAWLVWLNGNTQNPITSSLLLEVAPDHTYWRKAVDYWNENFKLLEWDTDRRHQKSKFGEATEKFIAQLEGHSPETPWLVNGMFGWNETWKYSYSQPYMGRLSAWSMAEYARILLGDQIPDADNLMLTDLAGSRSHRNSLAFLIGNDAAIYWEPNETPKDLIPHLEMAGEVLLAESQKRAIAYREIGTDYIGDVTRLTLESALCTYKSWHKPNRRYPNVYNDMMYNRIKKAESRFGTRFDLFWDTRAYVLPEYLLLEKSPFDPGMVPEKQNHYLLTGEPIMMHREYPDMRSQFDRSVDLEVFGRREK